MYDVCMSATARWNDLNLAISRIGGALRWDVQKSILFVPVAAVGLNTQWWHSWNCWQQRWVTRRKTVTRRESRWWFGPRCSKRGQEEGSSRFAFLFCLRCHNYQLIFVVLKKRSSAQLTVFMPYFFLFSLPSDKTIMTGMVSQRWSWVVYEYAAFHKTYSF